MVKPLTFKGDKKPKKRKRLEGGEAGDNEGRRDRPSAGNAPMPVEDAEPDDSWVSAEAVTDVVGPIMLVLCSRPPTSLACDANGKVFPLAIENIVEGIPSSAEPHDVRQVWVANRVAETENFRLKGHHGRWVTPCSGSLSSGRLQV